MIPSSSKIATTILAKFSTKGSKFEINSVIKNTPM